MTGIVSYGSYIPYRRLKRAANLREAAQEFIVKPDPHPPGEHIGIHTKTDELLDGSIKSAHLDAERWWLSLWRVGEIDLGIGHTREPL